MSIYTGIKKRWIEGDYAGSYRPGETGVEIRSPLFSRYLGRENIRVANVGFQTDGSPNPLIIATDLLEGTLDASGNQVPGKSDGLYYPGLGNDAEMTLEPLRMLLKRAEDRKLLTILPGDQHENHRLFDPNALTTTVLDPDLSLLTDRERDIVKKRYSAWIGKQLPAGVWRDIFMSKTAENPRGEYQGKEERNFLPHCTEGTVEYIQTVLDIFQRQKTDIQKQIAGGALVPEGRFLPMPKDGLTVDMPGDDRGMNGNKFDEMLKAAFTGGYFQGDDHRRHKIAIVAGACYEYSVRLLIEHLVDADINVICLLGATKGLDLFSSKLHTAHFLKELYGKKLFFTYEWIEALLGPKPSGWDAAIARVKQADNAHHASWLQSYLTQLSRGETSLGQQIMLTERELVQAACI